jgi:hypothetical protein
LESKYQFSYGELRYWALAKINKESLVFWFATGFFDPSKSLDWGVAPGLALA